MAQTVTELPGRAARLSESPGSPSWVWSKHVPFTAFLREDPVRGKRFETIRCLEQEADRVMDSLESLCGSGTPFSFNKPVAFTPQFGNKGARLTIHGFACVSDTFTKNPVGEDVVVNSGEFKTGRALNNSNRVSDVILNALVIELKSLLESASGTLVTRIELAGFIYGEGGVHFPKI